MEMAVENMFKLLFRQDFDTRLWTKIANIKGGAPDAFFHTRHFSPVILFHGSMMV
jgi:hypothetical protein